jgi:hypothetical protein
MTSGPTFIPGYLGTVLLNADDISAIGSVVTLGQSRNLMTKPTFGSAFAHSLGGQKLATFSANGHVSAEQLGDLQNAFNSDAPIAFSLQVGDAAGATDAGIYSGDCVLSSFEITASADGEWDWSIEAQTSGDVVYTAPSP